MSLAEGEVDEATGGIEFAGVDSCLCITVLLEDGTTVVGGHASLQTVRGKLPSNEILGKMKEKVGGRKMISVVLAGDVGGWDDAYLTDKPYLDAKPETEGAEEPSPNYTSGASGSVWSSVCEKLDIDIDEARHGNRHR